MTRSEVITAQARVRSRLEAFGLVLESSTAIEIADFGLGRWEQVGLGVVIRVNEPEYCSKYLTLEAGQECPLHSHKVKKETFFVLTGIVELELDGEALTLSPGLSCTLKPGVNHKFWSNGGAIIEEVSTHDENSDSLFANPAIIRDPIIEED